jgi:hypothetical protein
MSQNPFAFAAADDRRTPRVVNRVALRADPSRSFTLGLNDVTRICLKAALLGRQVAQHVPQSREAGSPHYRRTRSERRACGAPSARKIMPLDDCFVEGSAKGNATPRRRASRGNNSAPTAIGTTTAQARESWRGLCLAASRTRMGYNGRRRNGPVRRFHRRALVL